MDSKWDRNVAQSVRRWSPLVTTLVVSHSWVRFPDRSRIRDGAWENPAKVADLVSELWPKIDGLSLSAITYMHYKNKHKN